jgi:hypothetical protein
VPSSSSGGAGAGAGGIQISEESITELMGISGKTRDQCMAALRAAFGDPNRAFEYLMAGIGEGGDDAMGDDYGDEDPSASMGGGGAGGNPFAALASNPNFALIR